MLAFSGPGYLVAVGYMDPGNWATDLAGGSQFGYQLLFVVLASSAFAMVLQYLAIKLGIATGRDLAQMTREQLPRPVALVFWLMAEIMIVACDLAEVIGTAIALNLLFHIPLAVGVIVTAADVLVLLLLQNRGVRYLEALIIVLILTVLACFGLEIWFARPEMAAVVGGLWPSVSVFSRTDMLYIAVGILGATVMPHNLYLHSAVVRTRGIGPTAADKREAIRFAAVDSTVALTLAFLVNAAILVLAAATFYATGHGAIAEIGQAYQLLSPLLGVAAASTLFAVALLASGQNSTITGTLAGQVIMEGFLHVRLRPWIRRLLTRGLAIIPAIIVILAFGGTGLARLLVLSQVILSMQLSFAMWPLVIFTSRRRIVGVFVNSWPLRLTAGGIALVISSLNVWLVFRVLG
jgi:manganese transport protein